MLTLISFYYRSNFSYKNKDSLSDVVESIRRNIDLLQKNNWDSKDIIIKTNFDFSYKDIHSINFDLHNCNNLFLTKIIAAYEVLKQYPDQILWQHDHDTYQIYPFNIDQLKKQLTHDINMCNYWKGYDRPQGASVFHKGFSKTIIDLYNSILENTEIDLCDERFYMDFMSKKEHSINLTMPYEYNTGLTRFAHHKRYSYYPYCVHGDLRSRFDRNKFKHYINRMRSSIIK